MQVPASTLGHDMAQLLESGQAADVRFKVEEEELPAHKFILTARSPVFRSDAFSCFCAITDAYSCFVRSPMLCIVSL